MIECGANLFNQGNNIGACGVENQAYNNANQALLDNVINWQ